MISARILPSLSLSFSVFQMFMVMIYTYLKLVADDVLPCKRKLKYLIVEFSFLPSSSC